jgi:hypothetical protein
MSLWFFEDVAFDHAHADEAVRRLRRIRRYVDALAEARAVSVSQPRDGWDGRFRDDFDREFPLTQDDLASTLEQIDGMITTINSAATRAEEDQASRVRIREDYIEAQQERMEAMEGGG